VREPKLFALVALVGMLAGCAGMVTTPRPTSTGSSSTAQLQVSPSTLSFGNVAVGNSVARNATLTASGSSVMVSSAAWSGEGYSVSGITFPVTITPGMSIPFTVTFAPPVAGTLSGSINFISDASNSANESFSGFGEQPGQQHSVSLSWEPSDSQVAGYNVYRGTQSGGPYPMKLNSSPQPDTIFTDATVESGQTYFYVATSMSTANVESGYSNETEARIP